MKSERNEQIAKLYIEGQTQAEIAEKYKISVPRVGQIINRMGLTKWDRAKTPKSRIMTAVLLWEGEKEALRKAAQSDGKSMSQFISELIVAELGRRGVSYEIPQSNEVDVPLPLEN